MSELSEFEIGQTVEVQDGKTATVRFIGTTEFAAGEWIGVVLDDAIGKNDGSVKGRRYFTCEPAHGMFVRPSAATIIEQPTPKPKPAVQQRANGAGAKGRPLSMAVGGSKRQSVLDSGTLKRQSINASSPTPSTRLASPNKSPTKQSGPNIPSGNASQSSTSSAIAPGKVATLASKSSRMFMAPPPMSSAKSSRPSIAGTLNGGINPTSNGSVSGSRGPIGRMSLRPSTHARLSSAGVSSQASRASGRTSPGEIDHEALSPTSQATDSEARGPLSESLSVSSALSPIDSPTNFAPPRGRSSPKAAARAPSSNSKEVDDLKAKLRVLEKKRQEDREKLKALEKVQGERDKFESIIHKLQAKYQPQQQEIAELKKQIQDEEAKVRSMEAQQAEHDTVVEVATLDREMAEENAESLKTELDALRQQHEETVLEVEILREENQELGKEMSPEEKTSQGWLQMERSNERLREALLRLRDVTQQQESDLRSQVEELQKDLQDLSGIKEECLNTKESLSQSERVIEDLKLQLETALGAEEMIEELSEKNFMLGQKVEKLETDIEELESLKEISDEIELNHTETEKQLQDEIDYGITTLAEQKRKSAVQDETIQDLEYTVTRFQDLVATMQSNLQDMKASQQLTEAEANELNDRSKAMMDLNVKLQVSASKIQTKAIDLELRNLEAQEAAEHLAIVQRFLPEAFGSERNSVLAYLRFRRVGFKARLIHGFIKEKINSQTPGSEDDFFPCCSLSESLIWVSCMCERFIGFFKHCGLESFEKLAGALHDMEPVERAFSHWIDCLKRDELKVQQCVEELKRSTMLMTHLAEVHITGGLEQHADDIQMRASMLQSHLESAVAALSHIKSLCLLKATPFDNDEDDDNGDSDAGSLLRKADDIISQLRSAKVVSSKASRHLEDLRSRSLTLDKTALPAIEQTQSSASEISLSIITMGLSITRLFNEEDRTNPLTYSEVSAVVSSGSSPFSSLATQLASTIAQIQNFYSMSSSLTQTVEVPSPPPPPPWQLLAQKLRDKAVASTSQEAEVVRLMDEVRERSAALAMRDRIVEEMTVKVEVLEKRVGESGGRREQLRELETSVQAARSKEMELVSKLSIMQRDLQSLQNEREQWKRAPSAPRTTIIDPSQVGAVLPASTLVQMQMLKSEIATLQSTIQYLRHQTHAQHLQSSLAFLQEPLKPAQRPSQSPLQSEARDMLKEMLNLVTQPGNRMVKLSLPSRQERLKWRPAKQTAAWQSSAMREEWEIWRGWKNDISARAAEVTRPYKQPKVDLESGEPLARLQVRLSRMKNLVKEETREVRIVRPDEWEAVEGLVGIEAS